MSRLKTGFMSLLIPGHAALMWNMDFFPLGKQAWRLALIDTVPFLLYDSIVFPTFWVPDCS